MSLFNSKPLFGDSILRPSDFFGSAIVVQDFDQELSDAKPLPYHLSYTKARYDYYIYGLKALNGSNHWTRVIMVKPSKRLADAWGTLQFGPIEAIVCEKIFGGLMAVSAQFMEGVHSQVLGYVLESAIDVISSKSWEFDLEQEMNISDFSMF